MAKCSRLISALLVFGSCLSAVEHRAPPTPVSGDAAAPATEALTEPVAMLGSPYDFGDPDAREQLYLELINRARANPPAEGTRLRYHPQANIQSAYSYFGVDLALMESEFAIISPTQPLAWNKGLNDVALLHSEDMRDNNFQGHTSNDGAGPTAGTRIGSYYSWSSYGENVYAYSKDREYGHAGFEVDWGPGTGGMQDPRGHRNSIHNGIFREIGIGVVSGPGTGDGVLTGPWIVTQDLGLINNSTYFITGVVYEDLNSNSFYDEGEGISGVTVEANTVTGWYAVTATGGGYTIPFTSGLGATTVSFSGAGVTGSYNVTLASQNVKVDHVASADDPPTVATPAAVGSDPLAGTNTSATVLGADDMGEANLTYTWSVQSAPAGGGAGFSPNGSNAASSTTVTFTGAGAYTLRATIADGSAQSVTSDVTITVNQVTTSVSVTPAASSVSLGGSASFSASASDQFGDAMAVQPTFSWGVSGGGSIDGSGNFTAGSTAGVYTVTATGDGVDGTASVTVSDLAPTVAVAASVAADPVTGTSTTASVLGADDAGEASLTYTWSTTAVPAGGAAGFTPNASNGAKNTTVTFTKAGSYTLRATIADGGAQTATSDVTVVVEQTLSGVTISPATADVLPLSSTSFTLAGLDQFGDAMTAAFVLNWSVTGGGAIGSDGTFLAGSTVGGPYTITATDGGSVSDTATVTISDSAPTVATPISAGSTTVVGTSTTLSVLGGDENESLLIYTWSATAVPTGGKVAFERNGTNAAKNTTVFFDRAGSYTIEVTITDPSGQTITDSIALTVQQTASALRVSPSSAATTIGGPTIDFDAVEVDQFGDAMAVQPAITWALSGGDGSIDGSGVFSPGLTLSSGMTVTATSSGGSSTATVSVTGSADTTKPAMNNLVVTLAGTVDPDTVSVTVAGFAADLDAAGAWSIPLTIPIGTSALPVVATDAAGNSTTRTIDLTRPGNG